jgi:hypothetical protein
MTDTIRVENWLHGERTWPHAAACWLIRPERARPFTSGQQ